MTQKITPFLWFDKGQASKAAQLYTAIFKDSKVMAPEVLTDTPSGDIEVIDIELMGQKFTLMGAGPEFKFNESISFVIDCESQEEVDYYWNALTADGGEESQCGWLKDKFGVSWQVTPKQLTILMGDKDKEKGKRVMEAMLQMKKIVIADIEKTYAGE